jgi:TolB-like protein
MNRERWTQVRDLLTSAMELEPAQRTEFLQERCSSDQELRREVERLLSVEGKISSDFLGSEALEEAASRVISRGDDSSLPPGTMLGPYEVEALLGSGGMGEVFRARDTRLDRTVAIKVLPGNMSPDPLRRQRFEREARAISALQHPNICTLYDVGMPGTVQYLVMEYLEGETLAARLLKGRLPLDLILRYATEVADALELAHKRGIIHRDLKPGNIFLTAHGEGKVLDFGLAKLEGAHPAENSPTMLTSDSKSLTTPGAAVGTVAYMSPEQARGEELDARTDIFSLGAVIYEMATGRSAFPGKTSALVFKAILDETPKPPTEVESSLPPQLDQIVEKALEKDRDLRYQSAAGLRADLQLLKRDTDSARIAARPVALERMLKHRKLLFVPAACIAAIGLAAVGTWYRRSGRMAAPVDSIAVLPFTNVGGDANIDYLSDGMTESLITNLVHLPELKVKSRNSVLRYRGKEVDAQKVGNELGVSALVIGRVVSRGENIEVSAELADVRDNTEIWAQHYSGKSAGMISLQRQMAGDIAEKLRPKLSTSEKQQVAKQGSQDPEAYELYLRGRYAWNKRTLSDTVTAISYFNQAIAKDPGYALAYSGLADAYDVLPDYGGSPSENYTKSNVAARRALALDATLARPHATLGENEMEYDWDFAGGEAEFKKALELDPNDATAHQWYGEKIGMIGGREQDARTEINHAHQLDPMSAIISTMDGFVHALARQYDEAIVVYKKVANENPNFARVHRQLAYAYWGKRMYAQVIEEWKTYGELSGNRNESEFASALEQGFRSAGWKGALAKGIEARQVQRKAGYWPPFEIAQLYADLGDKDQTFRWLNAAYQERDPWLLGLKTEFLLDPIRSDPRFAELVRKVGLPQ